MKIKFCGAARTVTGSCHLLEVSNKIKILLDCGLYQGRDEDFEKFNSDWLFDPHDIDYLILSHAHIDHSGRIPKLTKDGFKGKIISTSATRDLCAVMLIESAKIQERDAEYINRKKREIGLNDNARPLYSIFDVESSYKQFVGVEYEKLYELDKGISILFKDSGHIFGSASITLNIKQKTRHIKLGYSGDIGRPNRPILKDPKPMEDLDYLICESTYGGQKHDDLPQDEDALLKVIYETCIKNKGKVLIPAFSVGRTQEIVYMLNRLEAADRLPEIPVFVDSPMAINATEVFKLHPECFDREILEYMIDDPNPFGFNNLNYIRKRSESKELNSLKEPAIIVSASGMMTGGRILHHLLNHIENENNTILIVGFCAPHTLGASLRRGDKKVRILGIQKDVKARVVIMDSFSAHGDEDEMIDYISGLDREKLKNVFLVHGDIDRQELFKATLLKQGFNNIFIPELAEEYDLI